MLHTMENEKPAQGTRNVKYQAVHENNHMIISTQSTRHRRSEINLK